MPTTIQRQVLVRLQSHLKHIKRYPIDLEVLITVSSIHPWLITTMANPTQYFNNVELDEIEKHKGNIMSGCKVKFVFDLVQKSVIKGEKVLVFSHNIPPINLLVNSFENLLGWHKGDEVLVLQGDQELSLREKIMEKFNKDVENKCKLLIASTSACAEGISLTAASRVILIDSEWNHSKTRQAIARAFRPGQERPVFVYKLLASGTWEEAKYRSNEWKAWLSKMISAGRISFET
ncbi:DNA repair and recombination protein RAD54 [Apostasia shenzhenica]|uniref:DNA repair and recombination protein RAD54 n=1 Tax=Apostasia shenzhenica TaxID=1088818 RepID=A0A2I0ALN1_9ASPA|nr:DNA repair and recombination protein RAD54 [Apostasia shenzhenica]